MSTLSVAGLLLLAGLCLGNPLKAKERHIRDEQSRWDPFHNECEINEDEREQCGRKTYDERECVSRGCCWQPCEGCAAEVAWCFAAKRMLREECAVTYEQKDDCGYYGITEGECVIQRQCCWRPSPLPNDPSCFQPVGLRLVNGNDEASGRVEVMHEGEWGTVCDDMFGSEEAEVICRQLGYAYSEAHGYAHFGAGSGQIWLDSLQCDGSEEQLQDCDHGGWGRHDCSHGEDASVTCANEPPAEPEPEPYTYSEDNTYDTYDYYTYDDYRSDESRNGFNAKPDKRFLGKHKRGMKAPKHLKSKVQVKAKRAELNLKALKHSHQK